MKTKKINFLKRFINNKMNLIDSKTINSNLTGIPLFMELFTIAAKRYLKNKKLIAGVDGYLIPGQEYFLLKKAYDLKKNSTIVEIGSYKGKSTICLALGCVGTNKKIYAIDTFKGNDGDFYNFKTGKKYTKGFLSTFKRNLKKVGVLKYVDIIKNNSHIVGKNWNKGTDMLFIDASHEYKDVLKDFRLFFPHVKKGGFVILHDVLPEFPGVLRVWENHVKPKLTRTGKFLSFAYGYKK